MDRPNFSASDGLIRAIAQDFETREVLMDAFMNEEAFDETMRTGRAVYYSRSRKKLWRKGEESGHAQIVKEIRINCYGDSLLLLVEQLGGAACHTGHRSCFYRRVTDRGWDTLGTPVFDPAQVYKK
jgi:phosphoribosyl-AMP cyclohydrolase